MDLLGRENDVAFEVESLGHRLLELDGNVVAAALRNTVDRRGIGIVHTRIDLEAVALAGAIFPGGRAKVAQRHLALAAVQLGHLAELRRVAFAGTAGEIVEDAATGGVDGVGAARFDQAQLIKRLMREKSTACRSDGWSVRKTRSDRKSGNCQQQTARRKQANHVFSLKLEDSLQ